MNPNLIILKKGHLKFLSQRKATREDFKLGLNFTYMLILFFIGILGVYYVWILNINATKGYNIRKINIEKKVLEAEKELLSVRIAELESIDFLMKSENLKYMKKTLNPEFLVIEENKSYVYNIK